MGEEQVRVWVGAFGKHPGWDDHIADQGLETELLTRVKRLLYIEGIGGNIDSGTWDGLDADERLEGFDHVLLWRWPGGLVVGRLWSSSDGKGRTRYPMIVCAHCRGLAGSWVAGPCLDAVDALAARCSAATDAAGVITAIDDARRSLRAASASAPPASREPLEPPAAIVRLAKEDALGKEGLERVLYQLEREFSSFLVLDEESGSRTRTIDVRPRHMRVPACGASPGEACDLWLRFLLERVDESVPLAAIVRRGEGFCDIIAGEPTRGQFSCFQSSVERMPLTTEIPYTIDDAFDERVLARIEAGRTGELRDIDPGRVAEQPVRARLKTSGPARSRLKMIGLVGGALVLLVVLVVVVLNLAARGGGGQNQVDAAPVRTAEPDGDAGVPGAMSDAETTKRREGFVEWCRAYSGWFGPLTALRGEERALFEGDAHLAARVLGPIEAAQRGGVVLNPLDAVSNPPPRVAALAEDPPAEVVETKVWDRTRAALAVIEAAGGGLSAWPTRGAAVELAGALEAAGVAAPAAELRASADALGGAESVVEAAEALSRVGGEALAVIAGQVHAIAAAAAAMRGSGDAVLAAEAEALEALVGRVRGTADIASLAEHAEALHETAELAESLNGFIAGGLEDVDPAVFAAQSRAHTGDLEGADRLRLWLAEARRPEMQKLDPSLDPRPGADLAGRLARVDEAIGSIRSAGREEMAAEVAAVGGRRLALGDEAGALAGMAWNTRTRTEVERLTRTLTREVAELAGGVQDLQSAISENVAEKVAELRSRDSISTTQLESIDEIWRGGRDALVARYEGDGNDIALFRDAQSFSRVLKGIEEATLLESGGVEGRATWNLESIQERREAAREAAVREHAATLGKGVVDAATASRAATEVRTRVGASEAALSGLLGTIVAIEEHLDALYGLSEPWPDGGTIRQRVEALGTAEAEARAIAPRVFEQVAAIERAGGAERAVLEEMADDASLPDPALVAVWRALGAVEPAWPGGAEELRGDMDLAERVRTAIRGMKDSERAGLLLASVDEAQRARWAAALSGSEDWAGVRECLGLREACGGRVADLGEAARFNLGVVAIGDTIDSDADDASNRARAAEVLRGLGVEAAPESEAGVWLARVRGIASEDGEVAPPLDPAAVGPATAGWRVVEGGDDERLVYELPGQSPRRLAFRLVSTPEGGAVYLCETELPVGVVAGLTRGDPAFARELVSTLTWIDTQQDTRRGMLTWEWGGSRDEPVLMAAGSWVSPNLVPVDMYFSGGGVQYPTEDDPMQRLSLSDAMFIAARLGCRLPTEAEWRAARDSLGAVEADGGWNLRDASLARQAAHVEANSAGWRLAMMPDLEAHGLAGEPSHGFDDGAVWLEPVGGGTETPFRHLIGNLHEYVILEARGQDEALGPRSVPPEQETAARWYPIARGVRAGVIGGSLFARSDAAFEQATEVEDEGGGWSDVGLRPAFSPGAGRVRLSVASRLQSAVDEAPLLRGE